MKSCDINPSVNKQKQKTYKRIYGMENDDSIKLACWENFSIPYINDLGGGNVQIIYECPERKAIHFYDSTIEAIHNGCRTLDDITKESLGIMSLCMNCPHWTKADR